MKVFPGEVLGPAFVKAVRAPLPQIRLMPTGGVDLETAGAFLKAGACCLGVGSQLVDPMSVKTWPSVASSPFRPTVISLALRA